MNLEKFDGVGLAKSQVTALITDSISKAMEKGSLKQAEIRQFVVEIPQDLRNGDYSTNVAMVNSKVFGSNPRAIATAILENCPDCQLLDYAPIGQEQTEYIILTLDSEEKPAVMIVNTEHPAAGVAVRNDTILEGVEAYAYSETERIPWLLAGYTQ